MTWLNLVTACDTGPGATVGRVPRRREQVERAPERDDGPKLVRSCLLAAMLLVAAGCAPSPEPPDGAVGAADAPTSSPDGTSASSSGSSSGSSTGSSTGSSSGAGSGAEPVVLDAGVRIGDGRAVMASTGATTTVVVTTIGVQVLTGEQRTALDVDPTLGPPTGLDVAADGSVAALSWPDHVELWAVAGQPERIERIDLVGATATLRAGTLFLRTETQLRLIDASDGSEVARHDAPGSATFGPLAVDPAAAWWAVPVTDPTGSPELLVSIDGGAPTSQAIEGRDGLQAFQVEADPAAPRVFVGLSQDGEPYSGGEIVVVDLGTGGVTAAHIVDPAALWDVGIDGGLVILDRDRIRRVDPDGVERPQQTTPDGFPPFSVHRLTTGGFVAVLQDGSRLVLGPDDEVERQPAAARRFVLTSQEAGLPAVVSIVDHTGSIAVLEPDGTLRRQIDDLVAGTINDIDISADGDLAVATSTGSINLLQGASGADGLAASPGEGWSSELAHAEGNVDTVVFSPDGTRLVGGVAERRSPVVFDDTVAVWDLGDQRRVVEIGGEREEVQDCSSFANVVRLASDGSFLVGLSHDFTAFVLDGETFERRLTLPPHAGPILDLALSFDDQLLATTSEDSTLRVWDVTSGELVADYPTIVGGYRSIDFLPDGSLLVADRQGNLSVLDPTSGEVRSTFESTVSGAADVEVSPDGRFVASGDGTVLRIWSSETGQVLQEFNGHYGSVTSMAFAEDSGFLVSGSDDGTAVVWDLQA